MGAIVDSLNKILGTSGMTIAEAISEYNGKHNDVIADGVEEIEVGQGGGSGGATVPYAINLSVRPGTNNTSLDNTGRDAHYVSNTKTIAVSNNESIPYYQKFSLVTGSKNYFDTSDLEECELNGETGKWFALLADLMISEGEMIPVPSFIGITFTINGPAVNRQWVTTNAEYVEFTNPFGGTQREVLIPIKADDLMYEEDYTITATFPGFQPNVVSVIRLVSE